MSAATDAAAVAPGLTLASVTPPAWAESVAGDLPALLSDHAHLELKAAASALALLRRHGRRAEVASRLVPLVREELEHLQRVLAELRRRGESWAPDRGSPYTSGLLAAAGRPRRRLDGYVDSLLVAALIEARSHERFEALRACARPELAELRPLYAALAEAEARHGELFVELALAAAPRAAVEERWRGLAAVEAELIAGLPCEPRIHGGPPRAALSA
jgi:tRNA-(ms[2]io[6]A)-hydroxylase